MTSETRAIQIAVEGCGHGTLDAIYSSIAKSCEQKGWDAVDLVIICGDFEALRNARDINCMAVPAKYREIGDFHKYYSGARKAPYLTIFIGGNHEASNYLWELYYGGWVAPNIYYMGAANVVRLGGLRIAGLSGIWKGYNYKKPHFERLPYNNDDMRSIYHVRELDVRKLLQIQTQVDVGLSHDWPRGVEWFGDHKALFRAKRDFEAESRDGTLGSQAAKYVLDRLRPHHWFSAHMHVKFAAVVKHDASESSANAKSTTSEVPFHNAEEIDLDMSDTEKNESGPVTATAADNKEEISDELRAELPASFQKKGAVVISRPEAIANKTTNFLALDKCLKNRHFLQLLEIEIETDAETNAIEKPFKLEYDPEWLAITRAYAPDLHLGDPETQERQESKTQLLSEASEWVQQNIIRTGKLKIPEDFDTTAPLYDASEGISNPPQPVEYSNPHTIRFCKLIGIENKFHFTEDERAARIAQGPRMDSRREGGRGGRGGRGGGRGRGRGQRGWGNRGGR
ncbi:MAG: hypothetical protein M1814_000103 [Vezdaea aestivalis]|nr:MAG: hypothetical protein M1814_000103 [Vezdaea aestivalis]